jgi:3-hydroxyisobutyrate dehydrogenase
MNVALLGTGTMGAGMARNLVQAGHTVTVWNRTPARAEGLGATPAPTPAEAVAGAEVVVTMLADGPAVDEVMQQALPAMRRDVVWAQMSTVGVGWNDRLAAAAREHGVAYVDAPVMGSRRQADEGTLLPLVSGPEPARARLTPVLEAIGRDVLWLGDEAGLATRLKLVANHWILVSIENLAETLALARSLGVEPDAFFQLLSGALFDMPYAHLKGRMMLDGDFTPAFSLNLARKDVLLALEAADEAGVELALARATLECFGRAIELGHGDDDTSATFLAAQPER